MSIPGTYSNEQWYKSLQGGMGGAVEGDVIFEHSGAVKHADVERLLCDAEAWSLAKDDPKMLRKRLVNVLMEALENLSRHVAPDCRDTVLARLTRTSDSYRLLIANAVPVASAAVLLSRVEILGNMTPEQLKEHNMMVLQSEGRTTNGGAGLGLVTMARKCNGLIVASSSPIDELSALFELYLAVALDPAQ